MVRMRHARAALVSYESAPHDSFTLRPSTDTSRHSTRSWSRSPATSRDLWTSPHELHGALALATRTPSTLKQSASPHDGNNL